MKKALLLAVVIAAAIAFPTAATAGIFHGVVIAKDKSRHALVIASRGHVRTIRTHATTRVSSRVSVHARRLGDGTFRGSDLSRAGRAHKTRFQAVVVAKSRHKLVVSAGRSTFDVHMASRHRGVGRGDRVVLNVSFSKSGELDEDSMEEVGHSNTIELEGTVTALTQPTSGQAGSLTLTSEDDNNQGNDDNQGDENNGSTSFTVVIPAGFDASGLKVGDQAELTASVSGSTLTLVSLDDEGGGGGDGGGGD